MSFQKRTEKKIKKEVKWQDSGGSTRLRARVFECYLTLIVALNVVAVLGYKTQDQIHPYPLNEVESQFDK